ncbi:MAG: RagB/SusD family nutrient uptake outer membrane protein [Bacteroidales bacterium]
MKNFIISICVLLAIVACNDNFLEKDPVESQTEEETFKTYENFRSYAWGMYDVFYDFTSVTRTINPLRALGRGDLYAGHLMRNDKTEPNFYASQQAEVFTSANISGNYYDYAQGGWNFSYIRRVNIMLDNIDASDMNDEDKAHWRSVGYFFHSFLYAELVSRYGDIPWVNHKTESEKDPIKDAPRTSRTVVVDSLMDRLLYAEANIKENGDGDNTINKACVQFLISRIGLFEGTWRTYHNVSDAESKYDKTELLEQSVRASEALMTTYPTLGAYDDLFNSPSLKDNPGVILYKELVAGVQTSYIARYCRTEAGLYEVPKHTVELFLSQNGLPIHNAENAEYDGDKTMYNEFRNRDYRLYANVMPPYYDATTAPYSLKIPSEFNTDYSEYVKLMPTIFPSNTSKRLPATKFNNFEPVPASPNIDKLGTTTLRTMTGYSFFRYYNEWEVNSPSGLNEADMPLFHMSEVLLNYAEAKWELGAFDQETANKSVNKLRQRSGVANMQVANIGADFDPVRDQTVDPVLWEIRRERIVEMLGEGCGFDDIRRWKRAPWYINRDVLGCYLRYSDYKEKNGEGVYGLIYGVFLVDENNNEQPKNNPNSAGYIKRAVNQANVGKGWLDKYYLLPIPLEEKALNPNLLPNNSGWE